MQRSICTIVVFWLTVGKYSLAGKHRLNGIQYLKQDLGKQIRNIWIDILNLISFAISFCAFCTRCLMILMYDQGLITDFGFMIE